MLTELKRDPVLREWNGGRTGARMLDADGFFQRFASDDPTGLSAAVAERLGRLAAARCGDDAAALLLLLNATGASLTVLRREGEARKLLEDALALARRLGDAAKEVEVLHNLATALQYLGEREAAVALFAEALAKAPGCAAREHMDFIHHHLGRCLVEQGRIEEARAAFARALVLRIGKGDARYIESTRRALAALG